MAEQKCYLVLHCLAFNRVSFGPLPVVVDLHPSVSVTLVLVVFRYHVADQLKRHPKLFVVSWTLYFVLSEKSFKA